jgi:hypothetical protein
MTDLVPKSSQLFECKLCDYTTSRNSQYVRHMTTAKHIKMTNDARNVPKSSSHICECGRSYKYRQGLFSHRNRCDTSSQPTTDPSAVATDTQPLPPHFDAALVIELLKQNQQFKDLIIEQNKQMLELANKAGNNNTTNCNNNNTTNNKFNLNVFLNENCKDAISMDDFIKSFEVTRDEFLHTGKVGYIEGLSAVMANRFKYMDVHTRPLHCTDLKRETIYIKNADKWEKDDATKTHMRKAVRGVARKNKQEMWRWYDENKPEVEQIGTDVCEDYFQYHRSTLGGYGKEEDMKFEDKIIHNVLTGVHIDKSSALTM